MTGSAVDNQLLKGRILVFQFLLLFGTRKQVLSRRSFSLRPAKRLSKAPSHPRSDVEREPQSRLQKCLAEPKLNVGMVNWVGPSQAVHSLADRLNQEMNPGLKNTFWAAIRTL